MQPLYSEEDFSPKSEFSSFPTNIKGYVRTANVNDKNALETFHNTVFGREKGSAKIYSELAIKESRTYILDISESDPFIASAITVVDGSMGEKHLLFGGTIPILRNRGLFSDLLVETARLETLNNQNFKAVCIPKNNRQFEFFKKRGFFFEAKGLECYLNGNNKLPKIHPGRFAGADYKICRQFHLKESNFSTHCFALIYDYYRSKGGNFGMTCDGYIAFSPVDIDGTDSLKKGKYIIDECAVSVSKLKYLPKAFEKCLMPLSKAEELINENIPFETVVTALANFNAGSHFINGVQRY